MNGDELVEPAVSPAVSLIDRDLVARDLQKVASYLTPLMMANLESLRTWRPRLGLGPLKREVPVGQLMHDRLKVFLPPTISGALAAVQTLSDGELRGLCAVVAGELGAWCRAAPAMAHLRGTVGERRSVDWSELERAMEEGAGS